MVQLRPHQEDILLALENNIKGQVISPTGSGKTMCMIKSTEKEFNGAKWDLVNKECDRKTIVIVAPRILLAAQLSSEFIKNLKINPMLQYKVLHVHSGEPHHFSTTDSDTIKQWTEDNYRFNKLIFTTYHSLNRIQESKIDVDTVYYDEAHNSTSKNFFPSVEHYSEEAKKTYYFTATPKHSHTINKPGMNDSEVYGDVLINVPAPKLVEQGHILPPKVIVREIDVDDEFINESQHIIDTIDEISVSKVLICARSTKQIVKLATEKFVDELAIRGYSLMYVTSKTGAFIDGKKVDREKFFEVLNTWGQDVEKKFIVLHHSILSEGISVRGLEAALLLRNMDVITLSQTIGRVIRTANNKTYGLVVVPSWDKVGISTSKKLNNVVETVFDKGEPATQIVRR